LTYRTPYPTRPGGPEDLKFLWEMLHEAAYHRPLSDPNIAHYLDEGREQPGDTTVVALGPIEGSRIGAAGCRLMPADDPGYGFVDASTPEIALAVVSERRGVG
jgi:hypothetical protein